MDTEAATTKPPYIPPPECDFDYSEFITENEAPFDSFYQEQQQRFLANALLASWPGPGNGRPWMVGANVGVFHTRKEPAIVPDIFIAVDVKPDTDYAKKENRSYFIWDMGKPPRLVVEFVSNRGGNEDTTKLALYGELGVAYYVIFDPLNFLSQEALRVYANQRSKMVLTQDRFFPEIDLGVTVWHGEFEKAEEDWLRWTSENGDVLPTAEELLLTEREDKIITKGLLELEKKRVIGAERKTEETQQKLEQEKQRADNALAKAEKLAAKLRALGIDPE